DVGRNADMAKRPHSRLGEGFVVFLTRTLVGGPCRRAVPVERGELFHQDRLQNLYDLAAALSIPTFRERQDGFEADLGSVASLLAPASVERPLERAGDLFIENIDEARTRFQTHIEVDTETVAED